MKVKKWHPNSVAKNIKKEITLLYRCYKNKNTPWYARLIILLVVVYALSPIDLIPDFIPILGYLDDLILLPLGIWLAYKLIPNEVISIEKAICEDLIPENETKNKRIIGGIAILTIWILLIWFIVKLAFK